MEAAGNLTVLCQLLQSRSSGVTFDMSMVQLHSHYVKKPDSPLIIALTAQLLCLIPGWISSKTLSCHFLMWWIGEEISTPVKMPHLTEHERASEKGKYVLYAAWLIPLPIRSVSWLRHKRPPSRPRSLTRSTLPRLLSMPRRLRGSKHWKRRSLLVSLLPRAFGLREGHSK